MKRSACTVKENGGVLWNAFCFFFSFVLFDNQATKSLSHAYVYLQVLVGNISFTISFYCLFTFYLASKSILRASKVCCGFRFSYSVSHTQFSVAAVEIHLYQVGGVLGLLAGLDFRRAFRIRNHSFILEVYIVGVCFGSE